MKLHSTAALGDGDAAPVPPDRLLAGSPMTRTWVTYEDSAQKLSSGQWEAGIGKWRIAYAEWEHVVMISGRCIITGDDGSVINAGPGDSFVIEPGFTGTWEVTEPMRKQWVIKDA